MYQVYNHNHLYTYTPAPHNEQTQQTIPKKQFKKTFRFRNLNSIRPTVPTVSESDTPLCALNLLVTQGASGTLDSPHITSVEVSKNLSDTPSIHQVAQVAPHLNQGPGHGFPAYKRHSTPPVVDQEHILTNYLIGDRVNPQVGPKPLIPPEHVED